MKNLEKLKNLYLKENRNPFKSEKKFQKYKFLLKIRIKIIFKFC
jgi:hypothetical protein